MRGESTVIEYLNKALRHELTAVNQYWLHYRLLDNWGYKDLAKQWRKESIEEMEHADKLVERIIFLDGFPNMQVLDPLHIGQNVKEVLDCDLAAEMLDQLHRLRSGMGENLLADLEHTDFTHEQLYEPLGLLQGVDVKGHDQALAHGTAFTYQLELRNHFYACA